MKKILLMSFVFSVFIWKGNFYAQKINDIIAPVKLVAGVADTFLVSDLFYSEDYDLLFEENQNIKTDFLPAENLLILKSRPGFEGMSTISFGLKEEGYAIPVISTLQQEHKFTFKPESGRYEKVNLFGSFNGWNRENFPMIKDKDTFSVSIPLDPGIYQYKYYANGIELTDPENPDSIANGLGGFNSVLTIPERHPDKVFLHVLNREVTGDTISFKYIFQKESFDGSVAKENVIALLDNKKIDPENIEIDKNKIRINLLKSELEGEKVLRAAVTLNGQNTNLQKNILFEGKPAGYDENFFWYDGVIYSIMIDRFADGDSSINNPVKHDSVFVQANYQGGDFEGIINKLEAGYFDSLGINIIWISPVYDNPNVAYQEYIEPRRWYSGYHGYWPISETRVEEKFGDMQKLKELVEKAHHHKIKILLDFVSNHVHEENPYWKNHPEWFGDLYLPDGRRNLRFWDEYRLTTWFEPFMPSFDYINSEEARDTMIANAVWWLEETGADGYRHDAVKHVPNSFWRELTEEIKEEIAIPNSTKVYQIGETFGSYKLVSSYVNNGQLDAQFNFNLYDTAVPAFYAPEVSFKALEKELKKTESIYGSVHLMGNIMDSHDKTRFMAYADSDVTASDGNAIEIGWNNPPTVDDTNSYDKAELYYAYMMTIPGLPVIYYGSEFGMTGAGDPDNRRMMRFGNELDEEEKEMLSATRRLVAERNENPALRYGDFYTLEVQDDLFAYVRSDFNQRVLVVLNKSEEDKNVNLEIPSFYNCELFVDPETCEEFDCGDNNLNLTIPKYGYKILLMQ